MHRNWDGLANVMLSVYFITDYGKLSEDDWKLLMTKSKEVTFTKNREIVMEGSQNKYMYKCVEWSRSIVSLEVHSATVGCCTAMTPSLSSAKARAVVTDQFHCSPNSYSDRPVAHLWK